MGGLHKVMANSTSHMYGTDHDDRTHGIKRPVQKAIAHKATERKAGQRDYPPLGFKDKVKSRTSCKAQCAKRKRTRKGI